MKEIDDANMALDDKYGHSETRVGREQIRGCRGLAPNRLSPLDSVSHSIASKCHAGPTTPPAIQVGPFGIPIASQPLLPTGSDMIICPGINGVLVATTGSDGVRRERFFTRADIERISKETCR